MLTPRGREIRCMADPTYACQQGCSLALGSAVVTDSVSQSSYDRYVEIGKDADAGDKDAIAIRQRRKASIFSQVARNQGCKRLNP